ncbi:MAG: hypothetical protein ACTSPD_20910 [Promethearchaeota archaeon]
MSLENHLHNIIHAFVIPFIILTVISIFMERKWYFSLLLAIILQFILFDIIIRRKIKSKIDQDERKWNLLRGIYFIAFFLMQFSLFIYAFTITERAGWIILILIILITIIFIIYLKMYEKRIFRNFSDLSLEEI